MTTYLLTWNPDNSELGGNVIVQAGVEQPWTCHSKQPRLGDTVFVVRLGAEPRGIMARGTVTKSSYDGADWKDPTKVRSYISFRADEVRESCATGLIPMALLARAQPNFRWSPQSSGISMTEDVATFVETLWESGRGKHSLRQYIEWSSRDSVQSRPDWLQRYRDGISKVESLRNGARSLDDAMLAWLWKDAHNGVCSVAPGFLSNSDYEGNKDFLRGLSAKILGKPDPETYAEVVGEWGEAKKDARFSQVYAAVIKRVFAALAPEYYTTILSDASCKKMLGRLEKEFELPCEKNGNWAQLNQAIRASVSQAHAAAETYVQTNIALWQLQEDKEVIVDPVLQKIEAPLNQILFGPPGTGKTYHTVNEALRILNPELLDSGADRTELKQAFDDFVASGQIVFTTFHQSFSYEDFVEGLRASTEDGQVQYQVEPGIFRRICERAQATPESDNLNDLLDTFIEQVEEEPITLKTPTGKEFRVRFNRGNATLTCEPLASETRIKLPANIEHIRSVLAGKPVERLYCASYVNGIAEYLRKKLPETISAAKTASYGQPHVLIIDEINRGNVSRIFGELITLIESSKRKGQAEALTVELPYSKKPFTVPDNVYLIGTMNTADRSLAGLDIALRRRFSFTEMPPKPDLLDEVVVEGVNVGKMLRLMNQRIAVLLDRDHCLGHAYFMPLQQNRTLEKLAEIFRQSIIPLLQEYFFEDWERISWVLNDHQKAKPEHCFIVNDRSLETQKLFGSAASKIGNSREVWRLNPDAFNYPASYTGIGQAEASE